MKRLVLVLAVLLLPWSSARGQTPELENVIYLKLLQQPDGGFVAEKGQKESTLRATSAAVRAIRYFGGELDPAPTAKFVASCFDARAGGFADRPGGKPAVATTAVGIMAVVALNMPLEKYAGPATDFLSANARTFEEVRIAAAGMEALGKKPAKADAWIKTVTELRNDAGTFGKGDDVPRATGGSVAAILRLGGTIDNKQAVLAALKRGQRDDGGFGKEGEKGSDLETSYRVMRAFHMLGEKPAAEKLRQFVERCRAQGGGFGVKPGDKPTVSGTYYAAIILHWLNKK
jgi:hypothetical protein